jgi:cytochrome c
MFIEKVYLKDHHLILREMDGSETFLTLQDALDLADWIHKHQKEIRKRMAELEEQEPEQKLDPSL